MPGLGNINVLHQTGSPNDWRRKMTQSVRKSGRVQVRAENPSGACGHVDHMTIDELKARAVGDNFDGSCPACGMFHLTRADIEIV